ncbi:FUSC family protein [Tepidibacter hydrothermalis]|uniref:Aromatic acid exporter family protein n=1 Tax=Tepidibacter hydrothermalis TaxID=3036126 RepID=A0ABY8EJI6_9FIRM|nr:aromatic acid exporter family protein [Tepidibacter hydrothermalis]WFD11220.1 aromatic acid exporter family protein [Tepidibacter hydrothermalis]
MRIGMRNIKTAIAVSLSVAISRFLNMEYPFYAAIAAIISMQTTIGESFKVGRNRMLGTILGAMVGVIFYFINPSSIIAIGIGITVVIYMCNLFGWNKSVSIAGIVFCVIMTNLDGRDPVFYGLNRIVDTFIGITIAVLVNYFIKPIVDYNKIEDELIIIRSDLNKLLQDKVINGLNIDLKNIEDSIAKIEKLINNIHINSKNELEVKRFKSIIKKYNIACMHLRIIDDMDGVYTLNNINYMELVNIYGRFDRTKCQKNRENDTVYNYHMRKIIKSIDGYDEDVIYFNSEVKIHN